MTIDEAIKHCEEVAEEQENFIKKAYETLAEDRFLFAEEENECKKCAEEHRQLAEWLRDYKRLLEQQSCKDAISRTDLDELKGLMTDINENTVYAVKMSDIRRLPPVIPQYTDAEIQKMQELEQAEIQKAYELGKEDTIKVLDKIRAKIEQINGKVIIEDCVEFSSNCPKYIQLEEILRIIDKYKENEVGE